jgi:hypothetical protein
MIVVKKLVLSAFLSTFLALFLALVPLAGLRAGHAEGAREVKTASTLVCGSASDAKQFLTDNPDLQQALTDVHQGSKSANSCLFAQIAYIAGKGMDRVEHSNGTYIVTEILIVGVGTPAGLLAIRPAVLYTVVPVEEQAA